MMQINRAAPFLSLQCVASIRHPDRGWWCCQAPTACPLTYFMRRDDSELAVFCFGKSKDAEAFAKRGRLPLAQR